MRHRAISIHAPGWGATFLSFPSPFQFFYFNPRTRVGCDPAHLPDTYEAAISIHAPGWGATCFRTTAAHTGGISIHAPGWGATAPEKKPALALEISIHAPGWGATLTAYFSHFLPSHFNPRTRVGCDEEEPEFPLYRDVFQSTHPGGVRRIGFAVVRRQLTISIHAPGWGATSITCPPPPASRYFNPRTRVGCDHPGASSQAAPSYFNPRTRVGCDWSTPYVKNATKKFQSTHPGGVRHVTRPSADLYSHFNPRTRVGCDPLELVPDLPAHDFNPRTRVGCDSAL